MEAIKTILETPELTKTIKLEVSVEDLFAMGRYILQKAEENRPEPKEEEEYLTPQEMADALKVSLTTIWNWDRKGLTRPLRIGNKKRYRKSDLAKILCEEEV